MNSGKVGRSSKAKKASASVTKPLLAKRLALYSISPPPDPYKSISAGKGPGPKKRHEKEQGFTGL